MAWRDCWMDRHRPSSAKCASGSSSQGASRGVSWLLSFITWLILDGIRGGQSGPARNAEPSRSQSERELRNFSASGYLMSDVGDLIACRALKVGMLHSPMPPELSQHPGGGAHQGIPAELRAFLALCEAQEFTGGPRNGGFRADWHQLLLRGRSRTSFVRRSRPCRHFRTPRSPQPDGP